MQNITIGRYQAGEGTITHVHHDSDGNEVSRDVLPAYDGWIEGVRDDGTTWIMWLDGDPSGGVNGDPVLLA